MKKHELIAIRYRLATSHFLTFDRTVEETLVGAIKQIRTKGYADKYRDRGESIHLVGMVFDKTKRNLRDIRVEKF